jgi:hypothetical protein
MKRRPTLRETITRNQASMDLYAAMSGKPRVELTMPPEPVKRAKRPAAAGAAAEPRGTEADVMRAVHAFLRVHPRVAWFMRINSGAVSDGDRHVVFYRLWMRGLGVRSKGMADYLGQMDDGRLFLLECKRPGLRKATPEQQELLDHCAAHGGLAAVVQSVEDVVEVLGPA